MRELKFQNPLLIALYTLVLAAVLVVIALLSTGGAAAAEGYWRIGELELGEEALQQLSEEDKGELKLMFSQLKASAYFDLRAGGEYESVFLMGEKQTGQWELQLAEGHMLIYGLLDPGCATCADTFLIEDMGPGYVEMVYMLEQDGARYPLEVELVKE